MCFVVRSNHLYRITASERRERKARRWFCKYVRRPHIRPRKDASPRGRDEAAPEQRGRSGSYTYSCAVRRRRSPYKTHRDSWYVLFHVNLKSETIYIIVVIILFLEAQGRTRPRKSQSGDNKVQSASDANAGTINSARSGDSSDSSYDSDDASYTSLDAPSPKSGGANLSPASAQEETKGSSPGSRKANRNRSPNLSSAPSPALKKIYDKNPNYKLTPLVSDQGLDKGSTL